MYLITNTSYKGNMSEILEGQQLEVDNLLSFRGKILHSEFNQILLEMKSYVEEQGAECIGNPITATDATSLSLP